MKPLNEYMVIDHKDDQVCYFHYEDEDGCHYDDLTSFLQCYALGFCGCGVPESNLEFIYHLLLLKANSGSQNIDYKKYDEQLKKYLIDNIDSVKWFFEYFLDKKRITTHGGNVSGSWIDDHNFFEALKQWNKERS